MAHETIEGFGRELAEMLEVDPPGVVSVGDDLFADWGLDSIQFFQVIVFVEEMAEVDVLPPNPPEVFTVGDAYAYYRSLLA
ncbi:MAG TPA: phosphopantetheine-binding protein [Acidimicrobiales bacterium]|nr:phosphopantetheine-binding protein [Acidimicrobiales bacterium]